VDHAIRDLGRAYVGRDLGLSRAEITKNQHCNKNKRLGEGNIQARTPFNHALKLSLLALVFRTSSRYLVGRTAKGRDGLVELNTEKGSPFLLYSR